MCYFSREKIRSVPSPNHNVVHLYDLHTVLLFEYVLIEATQRV